MNARTTLESLALELLQQDIASWLTYQDCQSLALGSKYLFFKVFNQSYLEKRPDQPVDIFSLIPAIITALQSYLSDENKPRVISRTEYFLNGHHHEYQYLVYNRESKCASWFLALMKSKKISDKFRLLSLSTLLNADIDNLNMLVKKELNGQHSRIKDLLIKLYTQYSYKEILQIEHSLLNHIDQSPHKYLKIDHIEGYTRFEHPDPFAAAVEDENFENGIVGNAFVEKYRCKMM